MTHVLVVEDDPGIAEVVVDYLGAAGFSTTRVVDAAAATAAARTTAFDLVVLDIGLPGGRDGLEVARELRRRSEVPIVMLTARDTETDRIVGLELGADDYVTKPFSPRELVARIRAVLRRAEAGSATTLTAADAAHDRPIRLGPLTIDPVRRRVTRGGDDIELTASEYDLLLLLAGAPGRVFTRGQLLQALRGVTFESYERAIDSHVKNLRRKIEADPGDPELVLTVRGVGYRSADA